MKGLGLIAVLVSLVIVAVLAMKQRNTAVKSPTVVAPSGTEVTIEEAPAAVQSELDTLNQQSEKRAEEGLDQE